jgi:hypothetical protein
MIVDLKMGQQMLGRGGVERFGRRVADNSDRLQTGSEEKKSCSFRSHRDADKNG